jgi:uncharacterized ion transporter superfamily protein YfcC
MNKKKIKEPNTFLIIFSILVLTAVLTWIIPGGKYQTCMVDGRERVLPGSFQYVQSMPQGISDVLMAPINGFIDAALIIGFVLIVGGAFYVLQATKAVEATIKSLVRAHATSSILQKLLIPIFMMIFSLAGAIFGMSEEIIPFVFIFVPLALGLGYDTVTGLAIPFIGAGAGFAAAFINPFTLGIAQGIADLQPLSGMEYRIGCWVIITLTVILFVTRYARKVRSDPERSFTFRQDQEKRSKLDLDHAETFTGLGKVHKTVLIIFALAMIILVIGVLQFQWYIAELSGLFLAMAIAVGFAGRLKISQFTGAMIEGAQDLIGTGLIIALARSILIIARDGQIIDTILYSLSEVINIMHPVVSAQAMFIMQSVINFFVPSGSGQAALTMPIMAPLSDLVGVSRQTAVLAFQFGDGFSNMIIPTSGVTMGVLTLAGIPWEKWARWILPLEAILFGVGLLLLIPPFLFGWQ